MVNKDISILPLVGTATALFLTSLNWSCQAALPRSEHPRPDFQRELWLNLNGEWQFEVDAKEEGEQRGWIAGRDLAERILVPFCPESKLSGLGLATNYMPQVWYRRHFQVPAARRGQRLLLHFGAVDYSARVWLNGQFLGEHRGGYTPFAFEVTKGISDGDNELGVQVTDDLRSGLQPGGKQSYSKSEGCVYTRITGIWQTVWLEAVGETYLSEFTLTPDLDGGRIILQGSLDGPSKGVTLRVRAYAEGDLVGEDTVPAAWRSTVAVLKLKRVVPWQAGKPFLYDLTLDALRDGTVLDRVRSYCGLRKITLEGNRFLINDPWHNNPVEPRNRYRGQPFFVSEFGGIHVKTSRDTGTGWGYDGAGLSTDDFLARYQGLTDVLLNNPNMFGFCYTQLTDVEQEQNGIYFYDRAPKYDVARLRAINQQPAAYETQPPRVRRVTWRTLVPISQRSAQIWRYTTNAPSADWLNPGFEDSGWKQGKGGFGSPGTPGAVIGTEWRTSDIWIRRTFRADTAEFALVALKLHHDEDTEIYLNGLRVAVFTGFVTDYFTALAEALSKAIVVGDNLLALHCHNTVGGQFIDAGIEVGTELKKPGRVTGNGTI